MRTVLVVLFVAGTAAAAPVPKELKKVEDKDRLVGKWEVARANVNGAEVANYNPAHTVAFTADGTATFQYPTLGIPDQPNQFKLDTAAAPRLLSFVRNDVVVGQPRPYEFRNGRLVMAISLGDQKPIRTLEPGQGIILLEYKRAETK